jgi:hypothetical protein
MKKGIGLLGVLVLVLGLNGVATADVVFDFDSYTTGKLNGQDDWSATDTTDVSVLETDTFENSAKSLYMTGPERAAVHLADQVYDSGIVTVEYANRRVSGTGAKSGKMILRDGSTWLLGVGVDTSGGDNWLVAHGDGGTQRIYGVALPSSGWFSVRIEVNLNDDTADVYWRATDSDPWTTVYTDYAVTANCNIDNFRLENRSANVGFDEISITPEPATLSLLLFGGVGLIARRKR